MAKKKLIMTGSEGVIGTILKEPLREAFDVYTIDKEGTFGEAAAQHYWTNIADFTSLDEAFRQIGHAPLVLHLAADGNVHASMESLMPNNVLGTANVYECVRAHGAGHVVFASSNHVSSGYLGPIPKEPHLPNGAPDRLIKATDPPRPTSLYGASKVWGESIAKMHHERYGITSTCLRIAGVKADDDPTTDPEGWVSGLYRSFWLSHRDLTGIVLASLQNTVGFNTFFAVSNNKRRLWRTDDLERNLGYALQDDAEDHFPA